MTRGYCKERGCSTPIWCPNIAKGRTHHRAIIRNSISLPVCNVKATSAMSPDDGEGTPTYTYHVYTQRTVDTRQTKRRKSNAAFFSMANYARCVLFAKCGDGFCRQRMPQSGARAGEGVPRAKKTQPCSATEQSYRVSSSPISKAARRGVGGMQGETWARRRACARASSARTQANPRDLVSGGAFPARQTPPASCTAPRKCAAQKAASALLFFSVHIACARADAR